MVGLSVSKGNQLDKYDHDVDILFYGTSILFTDVVRFLEKNFLSAHKRTIKGIF